MRLVCSHQLSSLLHIELIFHWQTLSFQKASSRKPTGPTEYHEHIVGRSWGYEKELEPVHASSRQKQGSSTHTSISATMQMWQEEKSREQPYNNMGSYTTESARSKKDKMVADGHCGLKSGDSGKRSSTASNCSGPGCGYLGSGR